MKPPLNRLVNIAAILGIGAIIGIFIWEMQRYPSWVKTDAADAVLELRLTRKAIEFIDEKRLACAKTLLMADAISRVDITIPNAMKHSISEETRASLVTEEKWLRAYLKKFPEYQSGNPCYEDERSNASLQSGPTKSTAELTR